MIFSSKRINIGGSLSSNCELKTIFSINLCLLICKEYRAHWHLVVIKKVKVLSCKKYMLIVVNCFWQDFRERNNMLSQISLNKYKGLKDLIVNIITRICLMVLL